MADIVPSDRDKKRLRACLLCSLIKTSQKFTSQGCDNCDNVLGLKDDPDRVAECTSANFEGAIALMRPDVSWRVDKFTPGVYAVSVAGKLPFDVQEQLMDKGIKYRARDGSVKDY